MYKPKNKDTKKTLLQLQILLLAALRRDKEQKSFQTVTFNVAGLAKAMNVPAGDFFETFKEVVSDLVKKTAIMTDEDGRDFEFTLIKRAQYDKENLLISFCLSEELFSYVSDMRLPLLFLREGNVLLSGFQNTKNVISFFLYAYYLWTKEMIRRKNDKQIESNSKTVIFTMSDYEIRLQFGLKKNYSCNNILFKILNPIKEQIEGSVPYALDIEPILKQRHIVAFRFYFSLR